MAEKNRCRALNLLYPKQTLSVCVTMNHLFLSDAGQGETVEDTAAVLPPPPPAPKASKFAAFLSANKAERHVPTFAQGQDEEDNVDGQTEGRVCKVEGCDNRAVENVAVCPMHTKR